MRLSSSRSLERQSRIIMVMNFRQGFRGVHDGPFYLPDVGASRMAMSTIATQKPETQHDSAGGHLQYVRSWSFAGIR